MFLSFKTSPETNMCIYDADKRQGGIIDRSVDPDTVDPRGVQRRTEAIRAQSGLSGRAYDRAERLADEDPAGVIESIAQVGDAEKASRHTLDEALNLVPSKTNANA